MAMAVNRCSAHSFRPRHIDSFGLDWTDKEANKHNQTSPSLIFLDAVNIFIYLSHRKF